VYKFEETKPKMQIPKKKTKYLKTLKYVQYVNIVASFFIVTLSFLGVTSQIWLLLVTVACLVICLVGQYFYFQNQHGYFQFSRRFFKPDIHSLHLTYELISELKSLKKKETKVTKGSTSKKLHDYYYQEPYIKAINWCFDELNAQIVIRGTHHLGRFDKRYQAVSLLARSGYSVKVNRLSKSESVFLRLTLVLELRNRSALNFSKFHIYKFEIAKSSTSDETGTAKQVVNSIIELNKSN